MTNKLFSKDDFVVVSLDIQDSMLKAIYKGEAMIDKTVRFFKGVKVLGAPIIVTQQYTKGLGETNALVSEAIGEYEHIEKTYFSCAKTPEFMERLESLGKKKVILTGMEAHICILQTALGLKEQGYDVYVLHDCISSRTKQDKKFGLERMLAEGIKVASYESVLFEALEKAGGEQFKEISKIVK